MNCIGYVWVCSLETASWRRKPLLCFVQGRGQMGKSETSLGKLRSQTQIVIWPAYRRKKPRSSTRQKKIQLRVRRVRIVPYRERGALDPPYVTGGQERYKTSLLCFFLLVGRVLNGPFYQLFLCYWLANRYRLFSKVLGRWYASPRSELGESTDWCQLGVQLMTEIPVTIQVGMLMHFFSVVYKFSHLTLPFPSA